MNLRILKIVRLFHLISKEDYNIKRQIEFVRRSPLFDDRWYLIQYPEYRTVSKSAAEHYVLHGWKEGKNPGPNFSTNEYLEEYPELESLNLCPLAHYMREHKELLKTQYHIHLKFITFKEMKFWILNKFTNKYLNKSDNYILLAKSKYFDPKWYLKQYPKVKKMDPIVHYLKYGWKEGLIPSKKFDGNKYLKLYSGVEKAGVNPLLHYIKHGEKEGRICPLYITYDFSFVRKFIMFFSYYIGKIFNYKLIQKNKKAKILVVLHLFYMDSWKVIKRYLSNLNSYNYQLIVTVVKDNYSSEVLEDIKKFKHDTKIHVYENYGFDIGSFVDILSRINLDEYDIVYKLQSKGIKRHYIFIYNQIFKYKDWFFNLFDGILGGCSVHKVVDLLTNTKKIGVVASKNLIVHDPLHKQYFTKLKAKEFNIEILDDYKYVAGSCFAIRASLLKKIQELKLSIKDFEETQRGTFSVAHALERLVCASIEHLGYNFYGIKVYHPKYYLSLKKEIKYSALRLFDDKRFIIDYEYFYKRLELARIYKYEVKKIKLKNIKRMWKRQLWSLEDTSAYKYLDGDEQRYQAYCDENFERFGFNMSKDRYNTLISSLNNSYNSKSMPILDGNNLVLKDGQHRCCYLMHKFGSEYKIPCLLIWTC